VGGAEGTAGGLGLAAAAVEGLSLTVGVSDGGATLASEAELQAVVTNAAPIAALTS
jgi:hypothetical protein